MKDRELRLFLFEQWVTAILNMQEGRKPNRKSETDPESLKTDRFRFTKKPEKPETEETETVVRKKLYLCTDLKRVKLNRADVLVPPSESAPRDLQNGHGFRALAVQGV